MNITEKIDNLLQYILQFVEKAKGYLDAAIEFLTDLRDRIDSLLDYIEEKLASLGSAVEELKHSEEPAA